MRQSVNPLNVAGTRTDAERVALSDAKYGDEDESTTIAQPAEGPDISATRSPVPTRPERTTRTVAPSTTDPVKLTREATAGTTPAVSAVLGARRKDRRLAVLYMYHSAFDAESGAEALACAAKPALKYGGVDTSVESGVVGVTLGSWV